MAVDSHSPRERVFTLGFVLVCLTNFALFGSFYLLLATMPTYIQRVGGTDAEVGLIIGVFATTALVLRPFAGRASDTRWRQWLIVGGAVIMTASSALYRLADSVSLLLALRVLHGVGWAACGTAIMALVADIVPQGRRGEAIGYFGMSTNLAMAAAPALGVFLMSRSGFGTLFLVSAAVAAVASLLALALRDPHHGHGQRSAPLLERTALFPSSVLCLTAVTYASIVSFLPLFAAGKGIDNPGLFFTVFAIVTILSRGPAGRLSDRHGRGAVILPGLALLAAGLGILSVASSLPVFLVVSLLYGLGFAAVQPALMALTVDRVSPTARGAAMGTFSAAMDLGIGAGSFLWGFVSQGWGFTTMYLVAAGTAGVAAAAFILGSRQQRHGEA